MRFLAVIGLCVTVPLATITCVSWIWFLMSMATGDFLWSHSPLWVLFAAITNPLLIRASVLLAEVAKRQPSHA